MDFASFFSFLPAVQAFVVAHPAIALGIALPLAVVLDVLLAYVNASRAKTFDRTKVFQFVQTQFATKTAFALALLLFAQASTPGTTSATFSAFFLLVGLPKLYELLGDSRDKAAVLFGVAATTSSTPPVSKPPPPPPVLSPPLI